MHDSKMPPVHPGEILLEDFILPMGISPEKLAREIHIDPWIVREVIDGKQRITGDLSLRLSRFLGTSAEVWINMQAHFDLEVARDEMEERIFREIRPFSQEPENAAPHSF
jgi:antitoxin HigA-1